MAGSSGLPVATQPDTSSPSAVPSSSASVTTFRVNAPSSSASPPSSGLYHHNYAHLPYWQNAWSTSLPPWASNGPTSAAQSQPYQYGLGRFSSHNHARHYPAPSPRTPTTNQPPSPPPVKFYKQWDAAIRSFLESVGLTQTLVGFQADMLVMNEDWEKRQVPPALETLVNDLSVGSIVFHFSFSFELLQNLAQSPALENSSSANPAPDKRTLDDRKLDYFQPPNNSEARSQTTVCLPKQRLVAPAHILECQDQSVYFPIHCTKSLKKQPVK